MRETTTAGDMAPPHGIPRPQWLVRFFDENGDHVAARKFLDPVQAEECAGRVLGNSAWGRTACLARFFASDGKGGWVPTGEEMEY